jgi:hypothetical protein
MIAKVYQQIDWIRHHKETWRNTPPWDRRAIIWAIQALPGDEGKHGLRQVKETSTDILEKAVAAKALSP